MPSRWLAGSRSYMVLPANSASAWRSRCMETKPSGRQFAAQQRRDAVAVFAIHRGQVGQHGHHVAQADRIEPGQWPTRIVDALLHGDVDGARAAHALVDG